MSRNNYGGKGVFELPSRHKAAMVVPKGGASCAKCKWVSTDQRMCGEPNFVQWNGNDKRLPAPAESFCSDWFEAK